MDKVKGLLKGPWCFAIVDLELDVGRHPGHVSTHIDLQDCYRQERTSWIAWG